MVEDFVRKNRYNLKVGSTVFFLEFLGIPLIEDGLVIYETLANGERYITDDLKEEKY